METTVTDRIQEITDILTMPAGSSVVYHVGHLPTDRHGSDLEGKPKSREDRVIAAAVDEVGNIAWNLHETGKVHLTQRRLGRLQYQYIATRARVFR